MKMRFVYLGISVIIIFLSYKYHNYILDNNENNLLFSYLGTVATLLALLITVCEIMISINRSKSIQKETLAVLKQVQQVDNASSFSDCLSVIDAVSQNLLEEKFDSALTNFQHFRKICVKVIPEVNLSKHENYKLSQLSEIEYNLLKSTKTSPNSPLDKMQKNTMIKDILKLKQHIENLNPARRN